MWVNSNNNDAPHSIHPITTKISENTEKSILLSMTRMYNEIDTWRRKDNNRTYKEYFLWTFAYK